MRTALIIILLLVALKALCPEARVMFIERAKSVGRFDKLIEAVGWVESRNNPLAYNPREGAVGYFQIRKCRIDEYNLMTGSCYTFEQMYDYELAKQVFIYYAEQIMDPEQISREWNGGKYAKKKWTDNYWSKVKVRL